jgi:prepilin-type N-terminal cleavage/methylation domain-containing protein
MQIRFAMQKNRVFRPRGRAGMTLIEVVIALVITGLTVAGIITGYIYCLTADVKAELMQAGHAKALERIEQARSAVWAPNRSTPQDDLLATNFPDLTVVLDLPGAATNGTLATIQTTIATISDNPPMRKIHVDCIWSFQGADLETNSIETVRAPDQ